MLAGDYLRYDTRYLGSSPSHQIYDIWGVSPTVRYTYTCSKWSAGTLISGVYANTKISGYETNEFYPQGYVYATYSPSQKGQVEVRYNFGKRVPPASVKSPNMLQQDVLMWYAGNEALKNSWNHYLTASSILLASNKFQFGADVNFYTVANRYAPIYRPNGPDGTMLRKYFSDGDFNQVWFGVSATGKFLGGKLVGKVNPQVYAYKTTGEYSDQLTNVLATAQLTYYFGNFYLMGWYCSPYKSLREDSGFTVKMPASYQIQLGWGRGSWRASVAAANFLNTSWKASRSVLDSEYYSTVRQEFGTQSHQRFQFALSYTFSYGKKVPQGDEVSGLGAGSSAILK